MACSRGAGPCEYRKPVSERLAFALSFFFSSRRRHTMSLCDWSSDVCSSDLGAPVRHARPVEGGGEHPRRRSDALRSEERRVGKEWRARWLPYPENTKAEAGRVMNYHVAVYLIDMVTLLEIAFALFVHVMTRC